jgi:twitching motility two-component system response regulator PilH
MAHILIVDDSSTYANFMRLALEKNGHQISIASHGEEGVEKAKELLPDLIIMDIVMPGLNGFKATRRITHDPETKSIPVIIVSSKQMESDRAWGLLQGAKAFLIKPVDEKELLDTIKTLLNV